MRIQSGKKTLLVVHLLVICGGCATLGPALTSLALSFGQDLLAAASVNYAPRYAVQVEGLLTSLASVTTGLQVEPQLAAAGYQPPPPKYQVAMANAGVEETASNYPEAEYDDADYVDQGYTGQDYPVEETEDNQSQGYDEYAADQEYANGSAQIAVNNDSSLVSLNAVLLVQRQGRQVVESVADGDVLRDGGANPATGDKLKVQFQANCRCYLYIIAVDATGYVAQIFPDASEGLNNPVVPQQKYSTPGIGRWWALDSYKGIETLYFVAARQPRPDLEQALAQLAGAPRRLNTDVYQPVMQPAVLPQVRGLVKVTATEFMNPATAANPVPVQIDQFTATLAGTDLAITRWFRHQ